MRIDCHPTSSLIPSASLHPKNLLFLFRCKSRDFILLSSISNPFTSPSFFGRIWSLHNISLHNNLLCLNYLLLSSYWSPLVSHDWIGIYLNYQWTGCVWVLLMFCFRGPFSILHYRWVALPQTLLSNKTSLEEICLSAGSHSLWLPIFWSLSFHLCLPPIWFAIFPLWFLLISQRSLGILSRCRLSSSSHGTRCCMPSVIITCHCQVSLVFCNFL